MTQDIHFVGIVASDPADYKNFSALTFGIFSACFKRDLPFVRVSLAAGADEALVLSPDIIGISSTSVNFGLATRLAEELKRKSDVPILVGGIHISLLPGTLPRAMDIGVVGEGEETLHELMSLYGKKRRFEPGDLGSIRGICYRDGDGVTVNESRPLIRDLDTIPHPDRHLIGVGQERAHILASRGCPFDCSFCSSRAFWGTYRAHSADYVLEEVRCLVEDHHVREIHFYDDLFVADRERLACIAEELIREGYQQRVRFSLALRAELADEELFDTLAAMGVTQVTFGAESCAPRVLQYLKGENANPVSNQRLVDLAHQHRIGVSPSFIKGTPDETGNDLLETYRFLISNIRNKKINYFEMHNLTPFPGTKVWEEAKERGLVADDMDWEKLRTPWEQLYMNRRMPKASFYFFETLNERARRMLGIFQRELVCILDPSGDEQELAAVLEEIESSAFFDQIWVIDSSTGENNGARKKPSDLTAFAENSKRPFLFCYFRPSNEFNLEAAKRLCWYGYDCGADFVAHGDWRHFSPVGEFERSLRVLTFKGLQVALPYFMNNSPGRDPMGDLKKNGLRVAVYRPDLDPFVPTDAVERFFVATLSEEFKIDKYQRERDKRLAIVEDRIHEKSRRLPEMEERNRRLRSGRLGRLARTRQFESFKKILRFLLKRD